MRILQIIDSLEIGGAERMAVNYANALKKRAEFSGLVTTRKEGPLVSDLDPGVGYFFMGRQRTFDLGAVWRLRKYCITHGITHLQAHSSSYFTATLVKSLMPSVKIIWHDHNGLSEFIGNEKFRILRQSSRFFSGILVVNDKLRLWAQEKLQCRHVKYLPNFISPEEEPQLHTQLHGNPGKRVLCLANLRDQKNHRFLLDVVSLLGTSTQDWTFHLVGKDFQDALSGELHQLVQDKKLSDRVFFYGSRPDSAAIIKASDICILTSKSEGLPVSVLEYGFYGKPVVVTNVGELPALLTDGQNAFICPKDDVALFAARLTLLFEDEALRERLGSNLKKMVRESYTREMVMEGFMQWCATL